MGCADPPSRGGYGWVHPIRFLSRFSCKLPLSFMLTCAHSDDSS